MRSYGLRNYAVLAIGFLAIAAPVAAQASAGHTLDNGLVVVVVPSSGPFEMVSAYFVGFRDEPGDLRGLAHVVEHMAMRESGARASIAAALGELGLTAGASTSATITAFGVTAPAGTDSLLHHALRIERERLAGLLLAPSALAVERRRVMTEVANRGPSSDASAVLLGRGSLGRVSSHSGLDRIGIDDVRAHHARYFVPSNLMIVVTSALPPHRVFQAAEAALGDLPSGPAPPRPVFRDSAEVRVGVHLTTDDAVVGAAATATLTAPGPQHPERIVLEREVATLRRELAAAGDAGRSVRVELTDDVPVSLVRIRALERDPERARTLMDSVLTAVASRPRAQPLDGGRTVGVTPDALIACEAAGSWRYCLDGATNAEGDGPGSDVLAELLRSTRSPRGDAGAGSAALLWPGPIRPRPAAPPEAVLVEARPPQQPWVGPGSVDVTWRGEGRVRWSATRDEAADSVYFAAWITLDPSELTPIDVLAMEVLSRTWGSLRIGTRSLGDSLTALGASVTAAALPYPPLATTDEWRRLGTAVTPLGVVGLQVTGSVPHAQADAVFRVVLDGTRAAGVDSAATEAELARQRSLLAAAATMVHPHLEIAFRRSVPTLRPGEEVGWRPERPEDQHATASRAGIGDVRAVHELLTRRARVRLAVLGADATTTARWLGDDRSPPSPSDMAPSSAAPAASCPAGGAREEIAAGEAASVDVHVSLCLPVAGTPTLRPEVEIANVLIGGREDAVLARRLRGETGLAYAMASRVLPAGPGRATLWYLRVQTRREDADTVIAEIEAALRRLGADLALARVLEIRDWLATQRERWRGGRDFVAQVVSRQVSPTESAAAIRGVPPDEVLRVLRIWASSPLVITSVAVAPPG